ncbi:unnamed protein product [Dovyalis caffra]|uniref:Uncharacterized protein n=1 Tax=Dovyalis caffra TaxID=77055 RepID=A0AAV1RZC6_9ROSI|nr:unnamed protein product [Dovyalis caffra]
MVVIWLFDRCIQDEQELIKRVEFLMYVLNTVIRMKNISVVYLSRSYSSCLQEDSEEFNRQQLAPKSAIQSLLRGLQCCGEGKIRS